MKFDMGADALSNLTKETGTSHTDLGDLLKALVTAVEPLEGRFNGAGRTAFDNFKFRADDITKDLNSALAAIKHGQEGMGHSFDTGDSEAGDNARHNESKASFDRARFSARAH
ncbi:hypothetical protein PZ938_15545 [Luteipulveratus sp. YIM 133132]|uniref:WXG100 family type VII secretion target n=1 Tax=Luteipulveratus flavus TaxID=3031728 RepID=A0ABT6C2I8_9MICO|nr:MULTISPECIES: hypothetical protein [unclassified Luteipulveratus]MDE9367030.1 hypothetical protein [Luteipulveratus sp. YIM 133132]MDF8263015.1 hypothetical protein [Luteipulveratus sp. YIM 133296]